MRKVQLVFFITSLFAGSAFASGFNLPIQSVSSMGVANQGGALAEDASTIFFNPAGIAKLDGYSVNANFMNAFIDITYANAKSLYSRSASDLNAKQASVLGYTSGRMAPIYQAIPSVYASAQINDLAYFGLGIYVPFGSTIIYPNETVLRYSVMSNAMMGIDINPVIGFKINENHSLAFGLIGQLFTVELAQYADFSPALKLNSMKQLDDIANEKGNSIPLPGIKNLVNQTAIPIIKEFTERVFRSGVADGRVDMASKDFSFGLNLGYLWDITKDIRLGISYRSPIRHNFKMNVKWSMPKRGVFADGWETEKPEMEVFGVKGGGGLVDKDYIVKAVRASGFVEKEKASMEIVTPQSASIDFSYRVIPELTLMTNFTWTNHSVMHKQVIIFDNAKTAANPKPISSVPVNPNEGSKYTKYLESLTVTTPRSIVKPNWQDTYKTGLGAIYQPIEDLQVKLGFQFDSSAVRDVENRASYVPDNHRFIFGFGLKYSFLKYNTIDFGYTFMYILPAKSHANGWCGAPSDTGESSVACVSSRPETWVDFKSNAHFLGLGYNFHYK